MESDHRNALTRLPRRPSRLMGAQQCAHERLRVTELDPHQPKDLFTTTSRRSPPRPDNSSTRARSRSPDGSCRRRSAVSMTTLGPSTWQVMTSTPWSAKLLVASASLTGSDHSPVKIAWVVMLGSTERAPSVKLLMLTSTCGMGFAAMKPIFFDLL